MSAEGTAVSFKYDHNGLRVEKVVEQDWYPATTKYTLHGKLITDMTVDYTDWDEVAQQDKLHFFYDALSRPTKVDYNGIVYTYVHNLHGDIVGLLDNNGALVVEYKYDAWGGLLFTTGSLADTLGKRNPFRYRGYVYDEETELYYLRSRFYCPVKCRFVNADNIMGKKGILFGHNGFAYCKNAPICFNDASGHAWGLILLLAVAVAATLTGCSQNNSSIISQYNCYAYAVGKTVWMNPGGDTRRLKYMRKDKLYKIKQDYFDVYDTAAAVISDLGGDENALIVDGVDSSVPDGWHMIALRTGSISDSDGYVSISPYDMGGDYHFMRLDNGVWSHKPGSTAIQYLPAGTTPDSDGAWSSIYTSDILYLIVRLIGNETRKKDVFNSMHNSVFAYYSNGARGGDNYGF